jgi:ribosomal protein S18 acetylase RimI-like enzyme
MIPHPTIRPYSDEDFEDYARTLLKTWPCKDIREARENVATAVKRVREGKEEFWVAEVDGKAAGFMSLEFTKVWGHGGEAFEEEAVGIDWFDVSPDFQRRGIGGELLLKAEERGKERGLTMLFMHTSVENLGMINFASKSGFRFSEYLKDFWGEGTGDAFLLTKRL